jgi:hypothetical protein
MRYIYYIIIIILLGLSAIIGYEIRTQRPSEKEAALIINDRVITTNEFNMLYSLQSPHLKNKSEFINSLITKELLIQESQKEGIDKEESFRRSIQNFYEQSLIKLLIDRKISSLNIIVDEEELNKYISFSNKKLHLTIFNFDTLEEAIKGKYRDSETRTVFFEELSDDIKDHVILLGERETTEPIKTDKKYITVRLDKTDTVPSLKPSESETEEIKKFLIERKKEKIINDWIADLRRKASIKILLNEPD